MINVRRQLEELAELPENAAIREKILGVAAALARQEQAQDERIAAALAHVKELMTFRLDAVDARQRQMLAMLEDLQDKLLALAGREADEAAP